MIVGIMSDSHGKGDMVRAAVQILNRNGAEMLFHCGDIGDAEVLGELLEIPTHFTWGNMDRPDEVMHTFCLTVDLPWPEPPVCVKVAGKQIAICHGHEGFMKSLVEDGQFDYVFYGHSHQPRDHRFGRTRLINPGALQRASVKTVATLDTTADELTYYEVPTGRVVEVPNECGPE